MATYVIGDVQGCFAALRRLLENIDFDDSCDQLWFCGDLVNRGPDSLSVLRFVRALGDRAITVLGNHDLHLLAVYFASAAQKAGDTLNDILTAPDCQELCDWLAQQPLLYHDPKHQVTLVHAGLAPEWDIDTAKRLAREVQGSLGDAVRRLEYFKNMYGDQPDVWAEALTGFDRLRFITNVLTRMRFLSTDGRLDLSAKGPATQASSEHIPWFDFPRRRSANNTIIFGHWAALSGQCAAEHCIALDTGCVWGGCLTAYCLETKTRSSVSCR